MKLYGTITSERASKGQGGNKYLSIIARISDNQKGKNSDELIITIWSHRFDIIIPKRWRQEKEKGENFQGNKILYFYPKGEKQKGELDTIQEFRHFGQNCIYNHDHKAEPELCEWHD